MTKLTGPLLSFAASGQIAQTQVYSRWKGRAYARRYVIPSNPNTSSQQQTRGTFSWLNNVWRYMPAAALAAWQAYATSSRFTDRNGFIKQNLSNLRGEANLDNFIFSPAAGGGLAALSMAVAPGNDQLAITLVPPTLPDGWTVVRAVAAVILQQDPQTGVDYLVKAGEDATSAYVITITGLANAATYVVGGWFEYMKPNGSLAYGQATMDTGLTT